MWKKDLSTVAILSLVASVHETAAFSNNNVINIHTTALSSCSRSKVSKLVLSESFYNYGKDGPSSSDNNGEQESPAPKKKGFFGNFFEELDAFVDDATSRRLGAGAQYYGKRKSSFYGANDANKKKDRNTFDATEDYRGPSAAGYFKWLPDPETGELKPVTRMKEVIVEKKVR